MFSLMQVERVECCKEESLVALLKATERRSKMRTEMSPLYMII